MQNYKTHSKDFPFKKGQSALLEMGTKGNVLPGLATPALGGQGSNSPSGAGRKAWWYLYGSGFVGMHSAKATGRQGLHQGSGEAGQCAMCNKVVFPAGSP